MRFFSPQVGGYDREKIAFPASMMRRRIKLISNCLTTFAIGKNDSILYAVMCVFLPFSHVLLLFLQSNF